MNLDYIVAGTGRSGTVFMARLLTSISIPCGHESVFDWRGLRSAEKILSGEERPHPSHVSRNGDPNLPDMSNLKAEASYMAVPFLKHDLLQEAKVIHAVRNPLKVANSFCHHICYFKSSEPTNSYEQFIFRFLPELKGSISQYERCALYLVRWNQIIENACPQFFFRVEDKPQPLLDFLGKQGQPYSDTTANSISKKEEEKFDLTLVKSAEIRSQFIAMGKKYGYTMASKYLMV